MCMQIYFDVLNKYQIAVFRGKQMKYTNLVHVLEVVPH